MPVRKKSDYASTARRLNFSIGQLFLYGGKVDFSFPLTYISSRTMNFFRSPLIRSFRITMTFAMIGIAQAQSLPRLELDEALRLSLQNNFSLSISRASTDIARTNREAGGGAFLPSASAYVNKSGTFDTTSPVTTLGASANWVVFDGFQDYHAYHRLQAQEQAAALSERSGMEVLMESVIDAYYNIVEQKQKLNAIRELLSVSVERAKLAQAKLEIGAGSRLDQLQSVADLNEDSSGFLTQQSALHDSKVKLNQFLSRDALLDFDVADSIPLAENLQLNPMRRDLPENNSDVAAARAQRNAAVSGVGEARGHWLPSLNAGLSYSVAPDALNSARSARTARDGFGYSLNLSVPLFDKLATPTGVTRAKLGLRQEETKVKQAEVDALVQFAQQENQYRTAQSQIALEARNLTVAKLQEEAAQERYRVGASTALEFRDAQRKLLDAEVRLISARQSAKQSETALRRLAGLLIHQSPAVSGGE